MGEHKVIEGQRLTLAAISVRGTFDQLKKEVPKAWTRLLAGLSTLDPLEPDVLYGAWKERAADGTYQYFVGVQTSAESVPKDFVKLDVSPQLYLSVHCRGHREQQVINDAYNEIHAWVAKNGYSAVTGAYVLEIYRQHEQDSPGTGKNRYKFEIRQPIIKTSKKK